MLLTSTCYEIVDQSSGGRSDQVMPGDEPKTPDKSKMLEERVLRHEAFRHRQLAEAVGNEGRRQGEARKPKRAQPAVENR
jgi:hypothetical protein